jgi:hypothetical protein
MQHLITIVMCKIWCNVGAGRCWHILPSLQISPHVITDCWHVWKNIFWINNLNQKTISSLLLWPLYIICAMMNTELQLMVCHVDGKSVWSTGHVCKHSGTSVVLMISCILLLQENHIHNFWN